MNDNEKITSEKKEPSRKGRRLKVLVEILIFIAYLLIIDQVLYHLPVRPDCESQNPYLEKIEFFNALPSVPDVVFLGSSRFWLGISPAAVKEHLAQNGVTASGYNFGASATTPFVHYAFLRDTILPRGKPLLVVLEVAAREMNCNNGRNETPFRYLSKKSDVVGLLTKRPSPAEAGALIFSNFLVSSRRFSDVRAWIQEKKDRPPRPEKDGVTLHHSDGWLEYTYSPPVSWDDRKAYWEKVYIEEVLPRYEIGGVTDSALRRLLDLARENALPVRLVNMPVTPEQMSFYRNGEYKLFIEYITALAAEYSLDFTDFNTPERRPPDESFTDTHHLNAAGALAFSKVLAVEVVAPALPD